MPPPDWRQVYDIAQRAVDLPAGAERTAFLEKICGSDQELSSHVAAAISRIETRSNFLGRPKSYTEVQAGAVIGDFEVIRELARSNGTVYLARQKSTGENVALKVLPAVLRANVTAHERFRREAAVLQSFSHPGMLRFVDFGDVDGDLFYAMEYVDGPVLSSVMDRAWEGHPEKDDPDVRDPRVVARLVMQVADALDYAHGEVVHRDVKPSNIMVDSTGRARLIDFGLALVLDNDGLTNTGDMLGTSEYMSPEQVLARRNGVDRRSDIFSLGTVLYEMLTRETPFHGESIAQIATNILTSDPKPPRRVRHNVPKDLETICLAALEKEPGDRYQTAKEMAVDLGSYLAGKPIHRKPRPLYTKYARMVVKRRTVLTAVPLALAAGAGAVWSLPPRRPNFRVNIRLADGRRARCVSRELLDDISAYTGELVDHGSNTNWAIDLPAGVHRLEFVDRNGDFAHVRAHDPANGLPLEMPVRLLPQVRPGEVVPGWSYVPAQTVSIPIIVVIGGFEEFAAAVITAQVDEFLIDQACLSNRDHRRYLMDAPSAVRPAHWVRPEFLPYVDRTDDEWLDRPAVYLSFNEAQSLAVWMGGRLPSVAEMFAAAAAQRTWWTDLGQPLNELLVVGRDGSDLGANSTSPDDIFAYTEGVRSRAPIGPYALHHPLGNVVVWTETPILTRDKLGVEGFNPTQVFTFGASWGTRVEGTTIELQSLVAPSGSLGGHAEIGIRRTRRLTPMWIRG